MGKKKRTSPKATRIQSHPAGQEARATKRFVEDLLIRGEAAKPTREGKLPLHATHVIKKQEVDGAVQVQRVRFKTF